MHTTLRFPAVSSLAPAKPASPPMLSRLARALRNYSRTALTFPRLQSRKPGTGARTFVLPPPLIQRNLVVEEDGEFARLSDPNAREGKMASESLAQTHELMNTMLKSMITSCGWGTDGHPTNGSKARAQKKTKPRRDR